MARATTALTATQIKTTKPKEKGYKLFDGGGLYLLVSKAGGKHWKLKYKFDEKEKLLSLGAYPDITISKARELREQYKTDIANGINPNAVKKDKKENLKQEELKQENTLTKITDEFFLQIADYNAPQNQDQ